MRQVSTRDVLRSSGSDGTNQLISQYMVSPSWGISVPLRLAPVRSSAISVYLPCSYRRCCGCFALLPLRGNLLHPLYHLPHLLRPLPRYAPFRQRARPPRYRPRHVGNRHFRCSLRLLMQSILAVSLFLNSERYGIRLCHLHIETQVSPAHIQNDQVLDVLFPGG